MPFLAGDKVYAISDPARIGIVERLGPVHAGQQYYVVFWGGSYGTRTVGELDLRLFRTAQRPTESLLEGVFGGPSDLQRIITLQRLLRDQPLRNNIYAFNASRTQFYPYQFKPLLKFLESPRHRLLICDEVGLGKTIEAGLILLELRARQSLRLILVVCPSNLRDKWRLELRQRFGEDFRILHSKDILEFFDEYEEIPDRVSLNGITSLETLRSPRVASRLEELAVPFDFIIVDEAHHMRNPGTRQRDVGVTLGEAAQAMVMLTATPVHLGQENLFSLLNILDEDDFPDLESARERFAHNEHIVRAQRLLGSSSPDFPEIKMALDSASESAWLTRKPLLASVQQRVDSLINQDAALDRKSLFELQRDLSEINLLGHILNRTRKRDVHEHVAKRRAQAVELTFSEREARLYSAVSSLIQMEHVRSGSAAGIQWRLNTPQRRIASSVQGMVEHFRETGNFDPKEDDLEENLPEEGEQQLRAQISELISSWPLTEKDAKYDALRNILTDPGVAPRGQKVLIFATFKPTLRYLARRLNADGIKAIVISGDTDVDDRPGLIRQFREDAEIAVLLCSRVGSEGLDFQFCSVLVNYDLPWNPMEVEQRIGRLDRIGQRADAIVIVNFWTKGTVEERILRRLYDRIGIFERSIGDLEAILGDVTGLIQRELFRPDLTGEETAANVERLARVIEQQRGETEALEASAAQFVGVDAFFEEEISAIKSRRRFVTGDQLYQFTRDFLKNNAPRVRLEYDSISHHGLLVPDEALREFLRASGHGSDALNIVTSLGRPLTITFDSQTAFRNPSVEFISVLHPLVQAIAEKYKGESGSVVAHHVLLQTDRLNPGFYFFFVYRLRITSARSYNSLECVVISEAIEEACEADDAEALLGELVEKAGAPLGGVELSPAMAGAAVRFGEQQFLSRLQSIKDAEAIANEAFIDQRLASLRSYYKKNIQKQRELLKRGTDANRQERYLRMLRGQMARLESELAAKERELLGQKLITSEYTELAAGILEVVSTKD